MDGIEQLYQQVILDHAQERHGRCESVSTDYFPSHQVNPTCGDEVTLGVELSGDQGGVNQVIWTGQGCSISQASLSIMTDLINGKTLAEINELAEKFDLMMHSRGKEIPDEVLDALEDAAALHGTSKFPNRVKCALLGWMALKDALAKAQAQNQTAESN